ncbi:MAG: helix-turn-helix transcriptional regulator [Prochloraceae cyanobacterium]|nr:helix-turn-helix transcriptional regulator [Prochloraceae cyanobacterium]
MNVEEFVSLNLSELAKQTGLNKSTWSRYINEKRDPSVSTFADIAFKLKMSDSELMEGLQRLRNIKHLKKHL